IGVPRLLRPALTTASNFLVRWRFERYLRPMTWASELWARFGGARPISPGDQLVCDGDTWTVSAVITERGGGREWPTIGLTRGTETLWITVDGDDVSRFEPLPDVRVGADDRLTWNGRIYTVSA